MLSLLHVSLFASQICSQRLAPNFLQCKQKCDGNFVKSSDGITPMVFPSHSIEQTMRTCVNTGDCVGIECIPNCETCTAHVLCTSLQPSIEGCMIVRLPHNSLSLSYLLTRSSLVIACITFFIILVYVYIYYRVGNDNTLPQPK
jgi:hypothetical protein